MVMMDDKKCVWGIVITKISLSWEISIDYFMVFIRRYVNLDFIKMIKYFIINCYGYRNRYNLIQKTFKVVWDLGHL